MQLRKYQQEAVESVFRYFSKTNLPANASPVIKLPTGSGKSLVIAALTKRLVEEYDCRVIMATHRAELIKQNLGDLLRYWPEADCGIYSASIGKRESNRRIIFAGIQSAFRNFSEFGHRDILIVDEAHMINPNEGTSYQKFIDGLRLVNNDVRLIGLTATPYRIGQGLITQGSNALFTSICYDANERDLIAQGFLSPLVSVGRGLVDTSTIRKTALDFASDELDLAFNVDQITGTVASDIVKEFKSGERKKALVYGTSIKHANNLAEAIRNKGLIAVVVDGSTEQEEREKIYAAFREGEIHCLCSCDVLTTGFNVPAVDLIAVVRATISTSLYVQILGRGMRIAPGKFDCLILDYGENVKRHGPIDEIKIKPKQPRGEGGKAPFKYCSNCGAECHAVARTCAHCDHEFPAIEKKASNKASHLQPLSNGTQKEFKHTIVKPEQRWICKSTIVRKHFKKGVKDAPPTVRVDYFGDENHFGLIASQWLCPEHQGFARNSFERFWRTNAKNNAIPMNCDELLQRFDELGEIVEVITQEKEDSEFVEVKRIICKPKEKKEKPKDEIDPLHFFDDDLPF
jgi:DNA repair protein RadD